MHADEINRAMTEALGREVYHYHLHVVYVPVVEKQILWSKRCKDKALVGTVKETVMQVSRSKKWASKPLLDDAGKPILQKNGKPVLKKSYSVLQDDFSNCGCCSLPSGGDFLRKADHRRCRLDQATGIISGSGILAG